MRTLTTALAIVVGVIAPETQVSVPLDSNFVAARLLGRVLPLLAAPTCVGNERSIMDMIWAPEEIGSGRRFRIVVTADSRVSCTPDSSVELLDRTAADAGEQRFYFRAGEGAGGDAAIKLCAGDEETVVHVRVVPEANWADAVTRSELDLPRIWRLGDADLALKKERTIAPEPGSATPDGGPAARPGELDWSDDQLWGLEPPCDIPRWHFMNLDTGCPVHGHAIFEKSAFYPWIVDVGSRPYQIQCPVGGEWYPTNDYASGDHTSGEFPDDGWGWHRLEPDGTTQVFGFISYYLLGRIRSVYRHMKNLSSWYEATGDAVAVKKITILLVTLAREHRYLSRFPEHRFRRYERTVKEQRYRKSGDVFYGPDTTETVDDVAGSGMDDYSINMPMHYVDCARAYDLVFDRIDDDEELIAFVSGKMPELADGPAIRRWIETFLFRAGAQVGLDDAMQSNIPWPQMGMISLIQVLDMPESAELTDWLVNGDGRVREMLVNGYYKDGGAYESVGYNGMHVSGLVPIADGLKSLCERYPDRYPPDRFDPFGPRGGSDRYREILRWPVDIVVAQLSYPFIGDGGGTPDTSPLSPTATSMGAVADMYRRALARYPDDETFRTVLDQLERQEEATRSAADAPDVDVPPDPALYQPSRLLDGYGLGILESGLRDLDGRRGAWLYYGDIAHHGHEQHLDIGLFAHRRNLLRHMGYPYSWQYKSQWEGSWVTHNTVRVIGDDKPPWWRTTVDLFHGGETGQDRPGAGFAGFQIVESTGYGITRDAEPAPWGSRRWNTKLMPDHAIRRAVCLVDVPSVGEDCFYVVDLLRVEGGREHWWSFHGLPGELEIEGPVLTVQDSGTVAGADAPYGSGAPESAEESLTYLYDVRRGEGAATATWTLEDADGLKLRMRQIEPDDGEVVYARGRSPHAPAENPPYELDFMLRHRVGTTDAPLVSRFTNLIEAGQSLEIEDAQPIDVDGVTGVRLSIGGMTHYVLRGDGSDVAREVARGVVFAGNMGFIERDDAGLRRAVLVGEGKLTLDGQGIRRSPDDWRGSIGEVDCANRTIQVEADTPPPEGVVGQYVLVSRARPGEGGADTFAYRVEEMTPAGSGRWSLRLNWSPLIGEGTVRETTERGFMSATQLGLASSRVYYRFAHVVTGDSSVRARIGHVHSDTQIEGGEVILRADDQHLASRFSSGTAFTIEEIGPGDAVRLPAWAEIVRREDGTWARAASGPADIATE